uniref:GrpE protein homolog n=1 Tax=Phallusia mammillata TaxID=59560 RepID=A0A6F9DDH9_9ASCI|nr:grpE protein homolog 1, mitochondrial-like [Phallusia mammillata]
MLSSRIISAVSRGSWIRSSSLRGSGSFSTNANNNKDTESAEVKDNESSPETKLQEDVQKLNTTIEELTSKYKLSLAENENVRKRLRKEIADAKLYGIQSFCKDLLDVADVLQMAIKSIPKDKAEAEADKLWKGFFQGVCLTDKELHTVFERHGLVILNPEKGEKFDPYDHEALFETPIEGIEPGSIAHIQRVGYKLKGRTIRPAQVGVTPK